MAVTKLAYVAAVYNSAAVNGHAPIPAVMQAIGKSRATASRQVAAARAAGLIAQELGGSSHINQKAVRVARALGVSYADLVAAIVEHAEGDLRIGTVTRG